ncbi:MAG: damage-inducible protein CinA [Sphingobacteriales bacterium]|nr:MAG: damage-inducible protein CinA [Sphingobacteriales bacterium]
MESKDLAQISEILLKHQKTVAVAESVTSGYLQFLLSNAPEAGTIFQGGITTYNCGQKAKHLEVEPIYATNRSGVGPDISMQMAKSVTRLFNAYVGVGITGFADHSDPEQGVVAYLSITYGEQEELAVQLSSTAADFTSRQIDFAEQAIKLLAETLGTVPI